MSRTSASGRKPYLILSLGSDSLAGWTINDGRIEPLALVA
jgi:hypothetical protein